MRRAAMSARSRSAALPATSISVSGISNTNSSPPKRDAMSTLRMPPASAFDTAMMARSGLVAIVVVDVLEVVDIDHQQRQRALEPAAAFQFLADMLSHA